MSVCLRKMIFFKQKTAYEMRISDWSSDVCSSDLRRVARALGHGDRQRVMPQRLAYPARPLPGNRRQGEVEAVVRQLRASNGICPAGQDGMGLRLFGPLQGEHVGELDRKSVVSGKSVSVRVDLGGRRIIKKKKKLTTKI